MAAWWRGGGGGGGQLAGVPVRTHARTHAQAFPGDEILMVADVDGAYGENFWLCGDATLAATTLAVLAAIGDELVDLHGQLKGILTNRDLRFCSEVDRPITDFIKQQRAVPAVQFLFNAVAFGPKGQMTSVARSATAQQKQNLLQKQVLSYGRTRKMER